MASVKTSSKAQAPGLIMTLQRIAIALLTFSVANGLVMAVISTDDTFHVSDAVPSNGTFIKLADAGNTSQHILLSSNGAYAWQFFPYNNHTQRLLVILSTLFNGTVVWIANRNHPVSPNARLLLELPSRGLALHDGNGTLIWSPQIANISTIVMNTTGNLYITSGTSSAISWQSFDEPTDAFVPGQRLRTNHSVTSSISWNNWASGFYTLKADPGGLVLYATFDAQQNMVPYNINNYITDNDTIASSLYSKCNHTNIIYNQDGSGLTLEQEGGITPECLKEDNGIPKIHGFFFSNRIGNDQGYRFLRLTSTGDIVSFYVSNSTGLLVDNQLYRNFFNTYCKFPAYCGVNSLCSSIQNCTCPQLFQAIDPANPTGGCRLQTPLNCSIFRQHQFLQVPGTDYFANTYLAPHKLVENPAECTNLCLENCSCTAAFYNNNTGACHLYNQVYSMEYLSNPLTTAFLRVASLPQDNQPNGKNLISPKAIVSVSISVSVVALITVGLIAWIFSRRRMRQSRGGDSDSEEEAFLEGLPGLPPRFSYKEVQDATEGFSKQLGAGASGAVYEGNLHLPSRDKNVHDSSPLQLIKVAVKELTLSKHIRTAAASKKQFRAEVATLGNLNHVNLVQLRGFCAEGAHRLLIYEFMENGSLDKWIFTADKLNILPWEVRYRIALDTARGLAFLHEECRDRVVHLDVKPQNILLDAGFRATLADFGLSKLMENGQSQTMTAIRGTPGYMAPELFLNLPVTEKSDVFSYGIVLLELVSGRKNLIAKAATMEEIYLPTWAVKQAASGHIREVPDRQLLTQLNDQDERVNALLKMERLIKVAFWCIQEDASSRPSMTTVLLMLEEHLQVPDPPLDTVYNPRMQQSPYQHFSTSNSAPLLCADSALVSPR